VGEHKRAIRDFSQAIRIDPDYAAAYYGRGIALYHRHRRMSSIADFTAVIRIDPRYAHAYYARGNVRRELGDRDSAIADFDRYLDLAPLDDPLRVEVDKHMDEMRAQL
jgi:tetratricopeptide (TPR) repeat protein